MEEIWKNIDGYNEIYQVSNLGNVRSIDRGLALPIDGKEVEGE